jgi:hypothetical protein
LFSGLSLWTSVHWVTASLLNKLVPWKLLCPVSLSEPSCNTIFGHFLQTKELSFWEWQ